MELRKATLDEAKAVFDLHIDTILIRKGYVEIERRSVEFGEPFGVIAMKNDFRVAVGD